MIGFPPLVTFSSLSSYSGFCYEDENFLLNEHVWGHMTVSRLDRSSLGGAPNCQSDTHTADIRHTITRSSTHAPHTNAHTTLLSSNSHTQTHISNLSADDFTHVTVSFSLQIEAPMQLGGSALRAVSWPIGPTHRQLLRAVLHIRSYIHLLRVSHGILPHVFDWLSNHKSS